MTEEMPEGWDKNTGPEKPEAAPEEPAAETGLKPGKRILIVDDDADVRKMVKAILEKHHLKVEEFESGQALLKNIEDTQADLILLDINMPGLDGITTLGAIRQNVHFKALVPIVMLTGQGNKESVVRSLKAGAVDFIVKPFTPEILFEKLGKHLPK